MTNKTHIRINPELLNSGFTLITELEYSFTFALYSSPEYPSQRFSKIILTQKTVL